jgi:hypothetical protein
MTYRCSRRAFFVAALAVPAMTRAWSSLAFFHGDDQYRGDPDPAWPHRRRR